MFPQELAREVDRTSRYSYHPPMAAVHVPLARGWHLRAIVLVGLGSLAILPGPRVLEPAPALAGSKGGSVVAGKKPDEFWSRFQRAVQEHDKEAVASMTRFPFVVRMGNVDPHDPMVEYDRKAFPGVLDRLLLLDATGGFASPAASEPTMSQVIAGGQPELLAHTRLGVANIGCFEFLFIGKEWKWTTVFSGEPELFGAQESDDIPHTSPLRKQLLDVVSNALKLRRPLVVHHLRRTEKFAYLEAQESGRNGRLAQALLRKTGTDSEGRLVWTVDKSCVRPAEARGDACSIDSERLRESGVPAESLRRLLRL